MVAGQVVQEESAGYDKAESSKTRVGTGEPAAVRTGTRAQRNSSRSVKRPVRPRRPEAWCQAAAKPVRREQVPKARGR